MKYSDAVTMIFIVIPWLAGVALAKGLWATIAAILLPFYAWYLLVERIFLAVGWL